MNKIILILFLLISCRAALPAVAQEENRLLEIPPGMTTVDLTGDGRPEVIAKITHDNRQGTVYDTIAFFSYDPGEGNDEASPLAFKRHTLTPQNDWDRNQGATGSIHTRGGPFISIDFWDAENLMSHEISTAATPDYMIVDYRMLFKNSETFLIKGQKIYASPDNGWGKREVLFRVFRLINNEGTEITPTIPLYSFEFLTEGTPPTKYQNIEDAFLKEENFIIGLTR